MSAEDGSAEDGPAGGGPAGDERTRRTRDAARRALFGDDATASADERDDADRARGGHGSDDDRRYLDERPPHHDRA